MANRNPVEALLDLVLYAPLGAAAAMCEELPNLADKGREMFDDRFRTARVVGQFVVAQGRREAERRINVSRSGAGTAGPAAATMSTAATMPTATTMPTDTEPLTGQDPQAAQDPQAVEPEPLEPVFDLAGAASGDTAADFEAQAAEVDVQLLAIPGYDSLSAPQVVQRLAGLSVEELEAVRRYEASHRGRQTILARVAQLHDSQ